MKKKVVTAALTLAMLATLAAPALAENNKTDVTYTQKTSYTLRIPETVTLSSTDDTLLENIGVSKVNTTPTEKVQVKIISGAAGQTGAIMATLKRENDPTTTARCEVTGFADDGANMIVAEFQDMSTIPAKGTGTLTFSELMPVGSTELKAGTYKATLVFEGSVADRDPT